MSDNKRPIIDYVIDQIELDIVNGDITALEELLKHIPIEYLQGYLPEVENINIEIDDISHISE